MPFLYQYSCSICTNTDTGVDTRTCIDWRSRAKGDLGQFLDQQIIKRTGKGQSLESKLLRSRTRSNQLNQIIFAYLLTNIFILLKFSYQKRKNIGLRIDFKKITTTDHSTGNNINQALFVLHCMLQ